MKLEELLNKLIEKGFVPFNIPWITELKYYETKQRLWITSFQNTIEYHDEFSLRDICSSESWLWQFVCENGMTEKHTDIRVRCNEKTSKTYQDSYVNQHYEYRLIESALKDESELEKFLLDNIKIDE